jgi:short-subunit dehydrogenase
MRQRVELGSEIEITIVIPGLIKSEMTQEIPKPARQIGIR